MGQWPSRVRKRDGREERFDAVRLADSIDVAIRHGSGEPGYGQGDAEETPGRALADAVGRALAERSTEVATGDIARAVEQALLATGWGSAAELYRSVRQHRADGAARLRVHTAHGAESRARPWDRHRLTHSLVRDRYVESHVAHQLSRRVERRLVAAGLQHVTGRVVAALADNECRSLGLRAASPEGEHVGLERSELRAWLGRECLPTSRSGADAPALLHEGADLRPALGAELLARFATGELLSEEQVEGLRAGRFDLPALGDWLRPAAVRLRPRHDESEDAFWSRAAEQREAAGELLVHWPAGRPHGRTTRSAPRWLGTPGCRLRFLATDLELARDWALDGLWVRVPRSCFEAAPAELQAAAVETGRIVLTWEPRPLSPVSSAGSDRVQDLAVVNLVAIAAGAAGDVGRFLRETARAAELAGRAMAALAARAGAGPRPKVALLPAGLPRALRLVAPGESPGSDRMVRALLSLRQCFTRGAQAARLRLDHAHPPHAGGAGPRLASACDDPHIDAYGVGWSPVEAPALPPPVAFATAPWLEYPATHLSIAPACC